MINAMLAEPRMRAGRVPHFELRDEVLTGLRVKRVRQWGFNGEEPSILPWIALNPSGFNSAGTGLSGTTMARLAFSWGFDGVATYNLVPFAGSKPKRDIWPLIQSGAKQEEIRQSHIRIANDLASSDAVVVGWGSKRGAFGESIERLARELVGMINSAKRPEPIRLWHAGLNENGSPKHAGARGIYRIPDDARPTPFRFRR